MGYPDDVLIGAVIGMYIIHVLHVSFNVHHDIIIMPCEAHFEGDVCNVCEHYSVHTNDTNSTLYCIL